LDDPAGPFGIGAGNGWYNTIFRFFKKASGKMKKAFATEKLIPEYAGTKNGSSTVSDKEKGR